MGSKVSSLRLWHLGWRCHQERRISSSGIIQRQGLAKLRHIDTSFLYIQQINVDKVLRFEKTSGDSNPSDTCTKGLAGPKIMKFIERMSMEFIDGRASAAPNLV